MRAALLLVLATVVCAVALLPSSPAGGASDASVRAKAVRWATAQAGLRENGRSNCHPTINRWQRAMGLRLPPCREWCGAIVHQAYLRAGVRLSARLIHPHRSLADARAGKRKLRIIPKSSVRPGDLLFFRFRRNLTASHLAIVRTRPRNGRVSTAEGNVAHRAIVSSRALKDAVAAARVNVG